MNAHTYLQVLKLIKTPLNDGIPDWLEGEDPEWLARWFKLVPNECEANDETKTT